MAVNKKSFFITVGSKEDNKREALLSGISAELILDDARIRKGHYRVTLENFGPDYSTALEAAGFEEVPSDDLGDFYQ
mgnify:CR=1 FL=1